MVGFPLSGERTCEAAAAAAVWVLRAIRFRFFSRSHTDLHQRAPVQGGIVLQASA